ncbi:hypothetical protein ASG53_06645 [Sanguibacter sp. Leaf3]|nr:hypothetical protein ASG53_06645 [Sanguibacter sp. Leaf3]
MRRRPVAESADRLSRGDRGADSESRVDRLERGPQTVWVCHDHQRPADHDPREGDHTGGWGHDSRPRGGSEVDAAVPGLPRCVGQVDVGDEET